jgi:uncharacterized membrane protein
MGKVIAATVAWLCVIYAGWMSADMLMEKAREDGRRKAAAEIEAMKADEGLAVSKRIAWNRSGHVKSLPTCSAAMGGAIHAVDVTVSAPLAAVYMCYSRTNKWELLFVVPLLSEPTQQR